MKIKSFVCLMLGMLMVLFSSCDKIQPDVESLLSPAEADPGAKRDLRRLGRDCCQLLYQAQVS